MNKYLSYLLFFGLAGATFASEASEKLTKALRGVIATSAVSEKEVGVAVAKLEGGALTSIYEHQSQKSFIPASVTKIIPAAAALRILGPTHKFSTEILSTAEVQAKILKGDIYLKGGGDPGFVTETLWILVNEFARNGIEKVEGALIVDDTLFDEVRFDPSREDSRVDRAYDAPVGAMSFNWNSVNVYVRPKNTVGQDAEVHAEPENEMVVVENHVKTVAANKKTNLQVQRKSLGQGKEKIIVTGQIALGSSERVFYKNVTHPALWSGANLKAALRLRGIEVLGEVRRGKTPASAKVLADIESKPVSHIVQDMMKFSNNYVAEMLTKHLALARGASQGTMAAGMSALQAYVLESGLKSEHFVLRNPSGLTRDNIFRPTDIVSLLASMEKDFLIAPEVLASFPLSGLDGTLKSRMKPYPGKVRAKTGLLQGVSSLAGWVDSKQGPLVFAFFYNGKPSHTESARDLFDKLLRTLVEME